MRNCNWPTGWIEGFGEGIKLSDDQDFGCIEPGGDGRGNGHGVDIVGGGTVVEPDVCITSDEGKGDAIEMDIKPDSGRVGDEGKIQPDVDISGGGFGTIKSIDPVINRYIPII